MEVNKEAREIQKEVLRTLFPFTVEDRKSTRLNSSH